MNKTALCSLCAEAFLADGIAGRVVLSLKHGCTEPPGFPPGESLTEGAHGQLRSYPAAGLIAWLATPAGATDAA